MARDYIKREQKSKKQVTKTESSEDLRKQIKVLFISFIAFVGLIIGVQYLTVPTEKIIEDEGATNHTRTHHSEKDKRLEQSDIPPPPSEKWDYVELLKNKEVEIKAKEQLKVDKVYQLQCGAYRSREQAVLRERALLKHKISSEVQEVIVKDVTWYRVILGPYTSMRKVESARHKLQYIGIELCVVRFAL